MTQPRGGYYACTTFSFPPSTFRVTPRVSTRSCALSATTCQSYAAGFVATTTQPYVARAWGVS